MLQGNLNSLPWLLSMATWSSLGPLGAVLEKASREGHRNELQVQTVNHGFQEVQHEGERKIAAQGTEAEGNS